MDSPISGAPAAVLEGKISLMLLERCKILPATLPRQVIKKNPLLAPSKRAIGGLGSNESWASGNQGAQDRLQTLAGGKFVGISA